MWISEFKASPMYTVNPRTTQRNPVLKSSGALQKQQEAARIPQEVL